MSRPDLKTRLGIRNFWEVEDGPLQSNLAVLNSVLGCTVTTEPEWQTIIGELNPKVGDKERVVEIAANVTGRWAKVFAQLLEDPTHEAWTAQVVDRLEAGTRMLIRVDVSDDEYPSTEFREPNQFILKLPRVASVMPNQFLQHYEEGLLTLFEKKVAGPVPSADASADDWAEVDRCGTILEPAPTVPVSTLFPGSRFPRPTTIPSKLPRLDSIPRPEKLMAVPPYHLLVYGSGIEVQIHATHSPTLELIKEYLRKWCANDPNRTDVAPLLDIDMAPSLWGLRGHDRLIIKREQNRYTDVGVAVPIILSLAEKLGYALLKIQGGCWVYRRDQPFQE